MNIEPTEERRMLADSLGRFIADRYGIEQRHRIAYGQPGYSPALWQSFAELGAVGALFPPSCGGFGGEGFDITTVFEALGHGLVVEPFLGQLMVGQALQQAGGHAEVLAALASGKQCAALAWEEADSRCDPAWVTTTARPQADGWTLSGTKCAVRQAQAAQHLLVSARTAGAAGDVDGLTLFLIPADATGVALRTLGSIDGGSIAEVTLQDVAVGDEMRVGAENHGHAVLEHALGAGVLALCAESLGAMQAARDATIEYLRTRRQFNVPIGSFQALQHRMATVLLEIEQARSAVINAAAAFDEDRLSRERALSAAKFTVGRVGTLVAEESIQMHGGIGMTWELPLAHHAKRLVMIDHQLGDEDYHLARYVALGRTAVTTA